MATGTGPRESVRDRAQTLDASRGCDRPQARAGRGRRSARANSPERLDAAMAASQGTGRHRSARPMTMDRPIWCAREDSNPRRPAPEAGALSAELRALVLLNVEQTGREASRCPRRESNPRLRFRRAASCPLDHEGSAFHAGARQRRTDGDGAEWQRDKCTLLGAHSRTRKRPPRRCPGTACRATLSQTTGPPESPARNEDTLRYATGSTTRGCSQGSTGRRRSCWTGSRTALLLSVMSGGRRTGMSSTEEDRTRLSRSTQAHFPNLSGIL